jgi:hypothetical protein
MPSVHPLTDLSMRFSDMKVGQPTQFCLLEDPFRFELRVASLCRLILLDDCLRPQSPRSKAALKKVRSIGLLTNLSCCSSSLNVHTHSFGPPASLFSMRVTRQVSGVQPSYFACLTVSSPTFSALAGLGPVTNCSSTTGNDSCTE